MAGGRRLSVTKRHRDWNAILSRRRVVIDLNAAEKTPLRRELREIEARTGVDLSGLAIHQGDTKTILRRLRQEDG